jgi:SAM-dependent methyltransferase
VTPQAKPHLTYRPLERLHVAAPVDRLPYLVDLARGKVVLDVGCYDETALFKRGTGNWLHEELAKVAREVLGIDRSENIPPGGIVTSPNSRIVRGDIAQLPAEDLARIDMIVAGEIIEHVPDTLGVLSAIASKPELKGKTFVATTPNATGFFNVALGMASRESQHPDHLQLYSYKTLNTLLERARFSDWTLIPYHVQYTELLLTARGPMAVATRVFQTVSRLVESAFPLLSGGWIVRARI